ncbi:hypothetical protein D0869_08652 [Hortaea werneckii]|uniref:Xylanolytic transcriptional activator regulatory domain-containing protein n=1 Tax=Hortaea werneckii TaxID=91943 RepID=A0A3M6WK97_HORWE|nr:hypothetical protein D0869_08652 [Hortaea werneckii]
MAGFMGTALIEGLLRDTNSPRDDEMTFTACVRSQASADRLRQKFAQRPGVVQVVQGELAKAAARADVVMLGCQPQELTDLLHNHDHAGEGGDGLVDAMKHKLVISLLAGVSCQQLLDALLDASAPATAGSTDQPRQFDIARVNPTMAASIGSSLTLLAEPRTPFARQDRQQLVRDIFLRCGSVQSVAEPLMDAAIAEGSTCHALAFTAVDAATDASVSMGLPRSAAMVIAAQCLQGASSLLLDGMTPESMKSSMSVPSGITINAALQLERGQPHGVYSTFSSFLVVLLKLPRNLAARVGSETDGLHYEKLQHPGTQPDLTTAQNSLGSVRYLARWRARERSGSSSTACESVPRMLVDRQNDSNDVSDSPLAIYAAPDSEMPSDAEEAEADEASSAPDQNLTNPLVSGHSQFTADSFGRPYYLGTSSNWAFARRVLSMVNEVVSGTPLPAPSLHPPYSTYDLGWDGRRTSASLDETALPTADFAMFLINATLPMPNYVYRGPMLCSVVFAIGQAMRLALEQGLHTSSTFEEQQRGNVSEGERYREAWWTVYMLDRHMSSLMGAPVALADDEITAQLPSFAGHPQKRVALEMQVRLSRVTTLILRMHHSHYKTVALLVLAEATGCFSSPQKTFIPFDLESAFSSAIVLMITATVDPSLIRKETDWLPVAYGVLEEMEGRGNLVASLRKSELEHLDKNLKSLPSAPIGSAVANEPETQTNLLNGPFENPNMADTLIGGDGPSDIDTLCDWNSEEALNGEQLMAVADSLDFSDLDWLSAGLADVAGNTFL